MATSKCYYARQSHRFLSGDQQPYHGGIATESDFEFNEWDLYDSGLTRSDSSEFNKISTSHVGKNLSSRKSNTPDLVRTAPSSLPVNVPDWSKILREEYRQNARQYEEFAGEEEGTEEDFRGRRVPPHEFAARKKTASFSVHEGVGRTLKGRDLSRVRNAIFEITGFED